jgi:hypothetical protein
MCAFVAVDTLAEIALIATVSAPMLSSILSFKTLDYSKILVRLAVAG